MLKSQLTALTLLLSTITPFTAPVVMAMPAAPAQPAGDVMAQGIKRLQELLDALRQQIPNPAAPRYQMPAMQTPFDVVSTVDKADSVVAQRQWAPLRESKLYESIYAEAIQLLFMGRGSADQNTDGWYATRGKGRATGLPELEELIGRGKLDKAGKDHVAKAIIDFDIADGEVRKQRGFPPQKEIVTEGHRRETLDLLQAAPTAKDYKPIGAFTGKAPTLAEMIDGSNMPAGLKQALAQDFLPAVSKVLYDKSVAVLNDPNKKFVEYYGRDVEVARTLDTISRIEKGHVLLTGKAGVGKTTILAMLSDAFVQEKFAVRDEKPPIVIELSILDVTNPNDPSAILKRIKLAQELARGIDRRIILYVDEAHITTPMVRNAIKSFLSEKILKDENQVHLVMSTTSGEARDFLSDAAFSRRFVEVFVREFNREETIALIKQAYLPLWLREHQTNGVQFEGISDDAFEYAYRNGGFEARHSGNPTGTKELLEGAITREVRLHKAKGGKFTLDVEAIRNYIKEAKNIELLPGDPNFDTIFNIKWKAFEEDYVGSPGLKIELKKALKRHFATILEQRKMTAFVIFGPPGGGKSFLFETLSKHFFTGKSSMLIMNGAELKNGGLELNKLIGSPPGTVGSEQQRSMLTKFMADNPNGGVMVLEEGDYAHQDVTQLFTNMITSATFTDGLGKEWKTGSYILAETSNIGQDYMIPPDKANAMNWEQYDARRSQITEKIEVDGQMVERVRPDIIKKIFDQFIEKIVTQSHPNDDTSGVAQEANKQSRRYTAFYLMPPNKQELMDAAMSKVGSYVERARLEHGVKIEIDKSMLPDLIAIDKYDFEKGYSYVQEQLEPKLFDILTDYLGNRGQTIKVGLDKDLKDPEHPKFTLLVGVNGKVDRHEIVSWVGRGKNPWADSEVMRERIKNFPARMREGLKGNNRVVEWTKDRLKLKLVNWDTPVVITKLGSTGNGKTQFFVQMAKALFEDPRALIKVSGLNSKFDLNNHFRPPTGIVGGTQETETERQIKSRKQAGGGIILFDELLSISGLDGRQLSERVEVLNELYDLLDTGMLRIGNKVIDCRGFVIGITGNALQELFNGIPDDPGADAMVKKILGKLRQSDITDYLQKAGIDAPKQARLGLIDVTGPLSRGDSLEAGKMMIQGEIKKAKEMFGKDIQVKVDDAIVESVVSRVKTLKLGMRNVNDAFRTVVGQPLAAIVSDIPGVKEISVGLDKKGDIRWMANGKPIFKQGIKVDDSGLMDYNWVYEAEKSANSLNSTPQLGDVTEAPKMVLSDETIRAVVTHEVKGHWAVRVLVTGKNASDAISIVPDQSHLGYVMNRDHIEHTIRSLSTVLAEMAVLEAGHRAVFAINKIYATGGGTLDAEAKNRGDDMAKVRDALNVLINNQLIDGFSEFSSPKAKGQIFEILNRFSGAMADYLVNKAHTSGIFDEIEKKVLTERFVSGDELDMAVAKLDLSKVGGPQQNIAESTAFAASQILGHPAVDGADQAVVMGVMYRLEAELLQKTAGDTKQQAAVLEVFKAFEGKFPSKDACISRLEKRADK